MSGDKPVAVVFWWVIGAMTLLLLAEAVGLTLIWFGIIP
jgi:hypothetical protein